MAIDAQVTTLVRAEPGSCFAAATNFARYPDWAKEVESVTIVGGGAGGRLVQVAYAASLFGKDYSAVVEYDLGRGPAHLSWDLVEARKLKSMQGYLGFEPVDGGTEMTFSLHSDLVRPRPPRHERRASRLMEVVMARDLRRFIERDGR